MKLTTSKVHEVAGVWFYFIKVSWEFLAHVEMTILRENRGGASLGVLTG